VNTVPHTGHSRVLAVTRSSSQDGLVTDSGTRAEPPADEQDTDRRKVIARTAARREARRSEAASLLRWAASACAYSSAQLANGLSATEARVAMAETAEVLAEVTVKLRRAARPAEAAGRARAARAMAREGMPVPRIALALGVDPRTVSRYIAGRPCP
jgi:hypothetical protein